MSHNRFISISIFLYLFSFFLVSQESVDSNFLDTNSVKDLNSTGLNDINRSDYNMKNGIESYKKRDYIDTIFYMDNVLDLKDNYYTEALFWKSKAYFELKHYKESQKALELLFKKGSITTAYYEDARFLYCKIFFMLGDYDDSLLLFNQFIRNPSFSYYKESALFWIGESYLQLSELYLAKESFNKYLNYYPESVIVLDRVKIINEMIFVLNSTNIDELSVVNKAEWLADYIYKEQHNNSDKSISTFLDKFKTREEFFTWLENSSTNLLPISKEDTIIDSKEKTILSELEKLLIEQIGADN